MDGFDKASGENDMGKAWRVWRLDRHDCMNLLLGMIWMREHGHTDIAYWSHVYMLSWLGAMYTDMYLPLEALVRMGYDEAEARVLLEERGLQEEY